jgi:hypothetical protein
MTNAFPAAPESSDEAELSDRQRREIEYHRDRAAAHAHFATGRVDLSAVTSAHYRWWNAYWVILRKAKNLGLAGKERTRSRLRVWRRRDPIGASRGVDQSSRHFCGIGRDRPATG